MTTHGCLLLSLLSLGGASVDYTWVSKTLSGKPCISTCVNGKCFVSHNVKPTACTKDPLAGVPKTRVARDSLFDDGYCLKASGRVRNGRGGETRDRADAVYSIYSNVNNMTNFPAASPYRFVATTTATNANGRQVLMPLILEARVDSAMYAPRSNQDVPSDAITNVNRMYDALSSAGRPQIQVGHLLAYMNGGTRDLFNFAGQTEKLNKGPYKVMENHINSWLRIGYVEFNVVVTYLRTRPSEFFVKVKFYNQDGSLHSDCLDMVFSNN